MNMWYELGLEDWFFLEWCEISYAGVYETLAFVLCHLIYAKGKC